MSPIFRPSATAASGASTGGEAVVDQTLNPRVASLKVSKTAQLTEAAREMKAQGIPVIELAAGEPDFDTPAPIVQVHLSSGQTHTCIYRKKTYF